MPLNLASPGIVVKEVDLTIGRVDTASEKVGAIVGPFAKGPVNVPVLVENEQDLLDNFGEPHPTDKHYEYWMTAASFLSYGGPLRVVRSSDADFKNGFAGTAAGAATSIAINSVDDYNNKGYDENIITGASVVAKNPGSWSNGVKVAIIDGKVDQTLMGIDAASPEGGAAVAVGYGVTQAISAVLPGAGSTTLLDGYLKGIVTEVDTGNNKIGVKVVSHVSKSGTETEVDYQPSGVYAFSSVGNVAIHTNGQAAGYAVTSYTSQEDWFDQQTITLTNSTIQWNQIADRPGTSAWASARGARHDELHVIVYDDAGTISGNSGTLLEKHVGLSKASDGEYSVGSPSHWRKFLASNSEYIFGGDTPGTRVESGFSSAFTLNTDDGWNQGTGDGHANGLDYGVVGNVTETLAGGLDYGGAVGIGVSGALTTTLAGLSSGYELFEDKDQYQADFLLMGSGNHTKNTAQALANKLIAVAELRKDAIAFISPYRTAFINDTSAGTGTVGSAADITTNVLSYYAPITSSTYAVFDSGYKYMYDRFSDVFRYVPLNGDIAGTCARNDINNFPWFSPAGTARGGILNAVKLAYNPSQVQRDKLYSSRINPVVFSPGGGIILFGDKTGYAKASAFDRINVRRLFIYLENAISAAARDQMFEFNDEITRTNFINIVEPFLRDVQAKRGVYDFRVICDETNNTAAIIDNNEFVADIFVKPARSINFIGLTFVATRTGVSFEEIVGSV